MNEVVATLLAAALGAACLVAGYVLSQERRITKIEERLHSLGMQMSKLPKRKEDS